ncbi:HEAT repeat domain-containing protein, partial [Klebsiella pneumoniae subsp. pneumoniae]
VLRHAPDPNQRLTAIFATRRMPGKEAIPILKLALRDPADDVRLLAYSMLDQKESRINQRIEAALGRLAGATPRDAARCTGPWRAGTGNWPTWGWPRAAYWSTSSSRRASIPTRRPAPCAGPEPAAHGDLRHPADARQGGDPDPQAG